MLRKLLPQKWTKIFLIVGLLNKKFHFFFKKYEKTTRLLSKMVYIIGMNHQNSKNSFNPILRKHLNADALFSSLHNDFSKISDFRQGNIEISMADALMSGFAMFSLNDPSLLAFDERRGVDQNLKDIYLIPTFAL